MLVRFQYWVFTIALTIVSRFLIVVTRWYMLRYRLRVEKLGTSSVRMTFASGLNVIDAKFVRPEGDAKGAVLICHGIGETVWHWKGAQRLLAQNGVASLMFNYSGWGHSTGFADVRQCEADALEAFAVLARLVPGQRISLLGYSLGTGIATAIAPKVEPYRLILCESYTSLRRAASSMGFVWPLPLLLPPVWDNVVALEQGTIPTLLMHGEADRLFPPKMARTLAAACASLCELVLVPDSSHTKLIFAPNLSYWGHIIEQL